MDSQLGYLDHAGCLCIGSASCLLEEKSRASGQCWGELYYASLSGKHKLPL